METGSEMPPFSDGKFLETTDRSQENVPCQEQPRRAGLAERGLPNSGFSYGRTGSAKCPIS